VRCKRVPIRWRRLFAWAIYSYERAGELEAQGVEDIDLAHRINHVHRAIDRSDGDVKETKTNSPRRVPIEPNGLPLVQRLVEDARAAGQERLVSMPPLCDLSDRLRQYLRWAGVTRAELFVNDATRKWITFHDLRATGITWMAIRGDEAMKVMHRAGHEDIKTTMIYVREAEPLDFMREDVFPPLPEELLVSGPPEGPAQWALLRNDQQDNQCPGDANSPRSEEGLLPGEPAQSENPGEDQQDEERPQRDSNPRKRVRIHMFRVAFWILRPARPCRSLRLTPRNLVGRTILGRMQRASSRARTRPPRRPRRAPAPPLCSTSWMTFGLRSWGATRARRSSSTRRSARCSAPPLPSPRPRSSTSKPSGSAGREGRGGEPHPTPGRASTTHAPVARVRPS